MDLGDALLVAATPVFFVDLPSRRIEALADRREHVLVFRSIRLCLRDVGLFGLLELDTHAVLAALALVAMRL